MSKGIYEIINNEGAICFVDTATKGKNTYGEVWAAVCESILNGKILEAIIDRFQYRTNQGEPESSSPSGVIVKIHNEVEAFLPISCSKDYLDFDTDYSGKRIAVMVESFDPKSLSIIVNEIRVVDSDFDIEEVNKALELVGKAEIEGKYVRGMISSEAVSYQTKKRNGFLVDIGGIEAYLPCNEALFGKIANVNEIIGHNILAGIKKICIKKMSIVLTMKAPYEHLIQDLPVPEIMSVTSGLVSRVTPDKVCVLLPGQMIGEIPTRLYQNRNYADWLNETGNIIDCIPFRIKHNSEFQYLIAIQNQE